LLKKHSHLPVTMMVASDLLLTAIGWISAYWIRFGSGLFPVTHGKPEFLLYLKIMPAAVLVSLFAYRSCGLYRPRRTGRIAEEMVNIIKACIFSWILLLAALSFYRSFEYSRLFMPVYFSINPLLIILSRSIARTLLHRIRLGGRNQKRCLIVGSGRIGQKLLEKIRRNAWTGIHVSAFVDIRSERLGKTIQGVNVEGSYSDLPALIAKHDVSVVFVALPFDQQDKIDEVGQYLSEEMVDLRIVPDVRSMLTLNMEISDFDGMPILSICGSRLFGWGAVAKRLVDIVFSALALAFFGIPMLVIAIVIKISSPGPILYKQERMGLDGKLFQMMKFRSMAVNAESDTGPVWARKNDTRRTWLGSFLRSTSIDELPQFINVLLGHMSVVGPRPERPVFIRDFKKSVPKYMLRHKMKAGITGWAQINGWRGNTSLEKRIQYDIYYIEHWSIWFDIRILFLTMFRGLINKNAY
jgi:Undecaprenyl-phosphate glucose phosphotransferase